MIASPPSESACMVPVIEALQHWLFLTETEADCIHRGDWQGLDGAQRAKQRLMESWPASPAAVPAGSPGPDGAGLKERVIHIVRQEQLNLQLLSERVDGARWKIASLQASSRNLRQIQGAYQNVAAPAWQSYS